MRTREILGMSNVQTKLPLLSAAHSLAFRLVVVSAHNAGEA